MKEVKPSKKPLAIYYAIVLLVLLVINLVVMPLSYHIIGAQRACRMRGQGSNDLNFS